MAELEKRIMKRELRKNINSILRRIPDSQVSTQSAQIYKKLLELPQFNHSKRICIYLHMNKEVCTSMILQKCFEMKKECFIPLIKNDDMDMVKLDSMSDYYSLPKNNWGIPEPGLSDNRATCFDNKNQAPDLVIVPGLAFDRGGNRLGRGKGFYDRFFQRCHEFCKTHNMNPPHLVGIAFDEQIVENVPVSRLDVPLDCIISPSLSVCRSPESHV